MGTDRKMIDINLTAFDEVHREEENSNNSAPENQPQNCHRHTPYQVQRLEAFFKDCPLPNKKQRRELGEEIGLEPLKVKFWFQNKRTHRKSKHERQENTHLWVENERLRTENMQYKEALGNACCPSCGCMLASLDDHHLTVQNARLRDEIDRISRIAAKFVGKPVTDCIDAVSSCTP